jgi:hypothetical protein
MSLGDQDYGVVSITSNAAHSGNYSLRIGDTADNPAEVVAISNRQPIEPGRSYGLSAWVKLAGVNVNPKREVETAVFFTVTYHTDAADWAEVGGEDFFVVDQSSSDCDWRLYQFTFTPPAEATRISVRARMQHQTVGDTYWAIFASIRLRWRNRTIRLTNRSIRPIGIRIPTATHWSNGQAINIALLNARSRFMTAMAMMIPAGSRAIWPS